MRDHLCGRTAGISLNQQGRSEAEDMSRLVAREHTLSAIYSSPLERAFETAEILSRYCGIPACSHDGLNEVDYGTWTGAAYSDLHGTSEWAAYNRNRPFTAPPGGEGLLSVQERAWTAIKSISASHLDSSIAIVSHGDVIRSLLVLLLGMPLEHILRLEVEPASSSEISLGGAYPVVHCVNRISTQPI
jgi:probable phosphoglycerate mutase